MIIWDEEKNKRLKLEKNISFEQISEIILEEKVVDVLMHPKKDNQYIFVLEIHDYIFAVPFMIDDNENIILKTAFPSKKLNRKYRGSK